MKTIGENNEHVSMDVMSQGQITLLENFIKEIDFRISINEVNYEKGIIKLEYTYNAGTSDEWVNENFMEVNVAAESVPCMLWETVNAVYRRCM